MKVLLGRIWEGLKVVLALLVTIALALLLFIIAFILLMAPYLTVVYIVHALQLLL